jgi:hypothetical protein
MLIDKLMEGDMAMLELLDMHDACPISDSSTNSDKN